MNLEQLFADAVAAGVLVEFSCTPTPVGGWQANFRRQANGYRYSVAHGETPQAALEEALRRLLRLPIQTRDPASLAGADDMFQ